MCVLEKHSEKQQELDKKEEEFQKEMSILERMLVDSMLWLSIEYKQFHWISSWCMKLLLKVGLLWATDVFIF